jgi:hypothetical protein
MGKEEGEEVQAKGIRITFNKLIGENFPDLEKHMPIWLYDPPGHQKNDQKIVPFHCIS